MEDPIITLPTTSVEQEVLTDITQGDIIPGKEPSEEKSKRYIKMVAPVDQELIESRSSPYCGIDSWVPSRDDRIVELPKTLVTNYKTVYPMMDEKDHFHNGSLSVITDATTKLEFFDPPKDEGNPLDGENSQDPPFLPGVDQPSQNLKPPLYHLVVTFEDDEVVEKRVLSLQRSHRVTDLVPLCEKCRECKSLFLILPKGMTQEEYLAGLLLMLKNHPLWHSGHIAAAMGIVEYFRPETEESKFSLTMACQPEAMNPQEIAVQYNQTELASILGAPFKGTEKEAPPPATLPHSVLMSSSNVSLTNSQL